VISQAAFRGRGRGRGVAGRAVAESVIAGLASQAVLIVSGVLVARALGVADRGHLAWLALIPVSLAQLGTLGLPLALTYFVSREPTKSRAIVHAAVRPAAAQAGSLLALHVLVLAWILPSQGSHVVFAGLVTLPVVPLALSQQYGLAIVQGQHRFRQLSLLRLLAPGLYSLSVAALAVAGLGNLVAITAAWVAASAVATALTVIWASRALASGGDQASVTSAEMRRFGFANILGSSSLIERFRVDQIAVGLLLSPAALGLYVVGTAFTSVLGFIAQSIGGVGYPRVAAIRGEVGQRRAVRVYFLVTLALCGISLLALEASVGWLVPSFFGSEFADAVLVTRILLIAALLLALRRVLVELLRGSGSPGGGNLAELVAWLSLLPALAVLTPAWGVSGAAASMVISSAASFAVIAWVAGRRVPSPSKPADSVAADSSVDAMGSP